MTEIAMSTAAENPMSKTSRQAPGAFASMPKAMPGFSVWTMLNSPGITVMES